jgi:hypothetical protein
MVRHITLTLALVLVLMFTTSSLAQTLRKPGRVIAVHENGKSSVRIGNEQKMVLLPGAKVGDMVVCVVKDQAETWECRLHKG